MIEVFKTNIKTRREALVVITKLKGMLPHSLINIDLQDCDKVLRIDPNGQIVNENQVMELVRKFNFRCEVLD